MAISGGVPAPRIGVKAPSSRRLTYREVRGSRKKHSSMKGSSGQESGARHGAAWKWSRASARCRSRRRIQGYARRSLRAEYARGGRRPRKARPGGFHRREPMELIVFESGNRLEPRGIERTAGTSDSTLSYRARRRERTSRAASVDGFDGREGFERDLFFGTRESRKARLANRGIAEGSHGDL